MKRLIAALTMVGVILATTSVALANTAATEQQQAGTTAQVAAPAALPDPGLTPDSFLYWVKRLVERVQVALTLDAANKAEALTRQAEVRLAEAKAMAGAGQPDLAAKALADGNARLAEAQQVMARAAAQGKDLQKLAVKLDDRGSLWAATLAQVMATLPEAEQANVEAQVADFWLRALDARDSARREKDDDHERHGGRQAQLEAEVKALVNDDQVAAELKAEYLSSRTLLVLDQMARESGRPLADVIKLYTELHGVGRVAKALDLKLGDVQHGAQVKFKAVMKAAGQGAGAQAAATETRDKGKAGTDDQGRGQGKGQGKGQGQGRGQGRGRGGKDD